MRRGPTLTAIRDGEPAVETSAARTCQAMLAIRVGVAGMVGMTGALLVLKKLRITLDAAFSANDRAAFAIFMVVIGGVGSIGGAAVGMVAVRVLREIAAGWSPRLLIATGAPAIAGRFCRCAAVRTDCARPGSGARRVSESV